MTPVVSLQRGADAVSAETLDGEPADTAQFVARLDAALTYDLLVYFDLASSPPTSNPIADYDDFDF